MVHCVAFGCNNKSDKKKVGQVLHFFSFPKDIKRREIWIRLLRRKDYIWKPTHKLCSDHFDKSQYDVDPEKLARLGYPNAKAKLNDDAVPSFKFPVSSQDPAKTTTSSLPSTSRGAYAKRRKIEVGFINYIYISF